MLELYFDFISPYAYLAWQNPRSGPRALAVRHGVELVIRPVLFAALLEHGGQLGPAEIPAKRAFLVKDVLRQAALEGIPLTYPPIHPFNPLTLLRLALVEVSGAQQVAAIDALYALVWGGVFGVPTVIARGELFWGSDRLADVDRHLAGHDPVDQALAAAIIARAPGPARRR